MKFEYDSNKKVFVPGEGMVDASEFIAAWKNRAELPGNLQFSSRFPTRDVMTGNDEYLKGFMSSPEMATTAALGNLHESMNLSMYRRSVDMGAGPGFTGGILTEYSAALKDLGAPAIASLASGNIDKMLEQLGEQLLMKGISLLAKIPVVGQILAALAAIGLMLVKMFQYNKKLAHEDFEYRRQVRDARVLDFGITGSNEDSMVVNQAIIGERGAIMQGLDWTGWFLPKYDWNEPWIGIRRSAGMSFFPGEADGWGDGREIPSLYNDMPCGGFIPGTQQITGEIQVLNPLAGQEYFGELGSGRKSKSEKGDMWNTMLFQGPYQIPGWKRLPQGKLIKGDVRDTGDFYPASAQLLTSLWSNIQDDGNPDLYRIDTGILDDAWEKYCGSAREYVKETCSWSKWGNIESHQKLILEGQDDKDIESIERAHVANFSCGIPCILGSWRCKVDSFTKVEADKYKVGFGSENCAPNFNAWETEASASCRDGDLYTDFLKKRLKAIRARQKSMLSRSLVCAYVMQDMVAFKASDTLKEKLHKMRDILLERKDQWHYLVEQDVPRGEYHRGENWYNLLKSRGAFSPAYQSGMDQIMNRRLARKKFQPLGGLFDRAAGEATLFPGKIAPPVGLSGRVPGQEELDAAAEADRRRGGSGSALPLVFGLAAVALIMMNRK
jgi:hypothetical protein